MARPEAQDGDTQGPGGGGTPPGPNAPYRAEAARDADRWHLSLQSLHVHPDRGEVDAVVVTVTPQDAARFPATELDRTLRRCGFTRDAEWTRDGDTWSAPCHQADPTAAPPGSPPRDR